MHGRERPISNSEEIGAADARLRAVAMMSAILQPLIVGLTVPSGSNQRWPSSKLTEKGMNVQMTVAKKISLTCVLLLAFTAAIGTTGLLSIGWIGGTIQAIAADALPGVYDIGRAESLAKDIRSAMLMHIACGNEEDIAKLEANILEDQRKLRDALKNYEKTITRAQDRELFLKIGPAFDAFMAAWEKPRSLSRALKTQQALAAFRSDTATAFAELQTAISSEVTFNKKSADEFAQAALTGAGRGRFWTWAMLLLAILCGGGAAFYAITSTRKVLTQSIVELSQGAEQLASAASQVSSASQALAEGASEQAASLEQTSASTEEINSMAQKNSENSQAASGEMSSGAQIVADANTRLGGMVAAMKDITESSNKISKIIRVIDEIAFQTNILALNAAVEAARAGEAGMGFAVVAEEVRNLAQRSAQAARDTAALIEEAIDKSTVGSRNLDQVTQAMDTVTASASRVKTLVDEVNLGSQEQARGIEQIGKAIVQMEQVTQKAAANAEESASAAEQLTAQSEALRHIVRRLTSLVHGGDAQPSAGVAADNGSRRHGSFDVAASHAAVSRKTKLRSERLMAAAAKDVNALPMEEDFKPF